MPAEAAALTRHYQTEDLLGRIRAALKEAGADPTAPSPDDLKPVDEFHTGGLEATEALLSQLEIGPDMTVLDLGSGIGGTAREVISRQLQEFQRRGWLTLSRGVIRLDDATALAGLTKG